MPNEISFNNLADAAAARAKADKALDLRVAALETEVPNTLGFNFVDQEVVTFDVNGAYTLAAAPNGVVANSVPLLTLNGAPQMGTGASKRFDVINDAGGVKRKLQLYGARTYANFNRFDMPILLKTYGAYTGLGIDATDVRATTSASSALVIGTGNFTVEAWVYSSALATNNAILSVGGNGANQFELGLASGTDGLYFYANSAFVARNYANGTSFPLNQWNHVAAVRSGTTLTLYINGVASATGTTAIDFTSPFYTVGDLSAGGRPFKGGIRNVRVTKYARYTSTFTPSTDYPVTADIVGLNDPQAASTVFLAPFVTTTTWTTGYTTLLPAAGTKCLVSYRALIP